MAIIATHKERFITETKLTFYPQFPEYAIDRYDSYFLLRFFPERWQRDYFLSGKLYMRQQTEFSNSEIGIGRSDFTEGAGLVVMPWNTNTFPDIRVFQEKDTAYVKIDEYKTRPEGYRDSQGFISYPPENQRRNLFCMYTFWCNKQSTATCKLDVDNMSNFGEYGILITDLREFLNRITTAANENQTILNVNCGFVHYVKAQNMRNVMQMNPFVKLADNYAYQNEFRFCAETDNENLLELDTKASFRDIAVPIRLHDFSETVVFKNGQLFFKPDIAESS